MIGRVMRLGKGIRINKKNYIALVLDCGDENIVDVYVSIDYNPNIFIGKEVSIELTEKSFVKSPMKDYRILICSDNVTFA